MAGRDPAVQAVDQTYGQRSVFGAANQKTAPVDEDLDIEDEQDALEYLRLVRAEARKIPNVMIARYGPQAFPPQLSTEDSTDSKPELKAKRRRRRRHWDEQDDGIPASKKRKGGHATVTVELSYDEEEVTEEVTEEDEECEFEDGEDYENNEDAERPENETPDRRVYENGVGDSRGYYHDGAYTAAPDSVDETRQDGPQAAHGGGDAAYGKTPSEIAEAEAAAFTTAYRTHLLSHFATMRTLLQQDPPTEAIEALPPDHDTFVAPLSTRSGAFRRWTTLLQTTDPLPAQVAAMDKVSVFRLLRVLLRGLESVTSASSRSSRSARFDRAMGLATGRQPLTMNARTSQWLWALFARLPERGELDYQEIGHIRDVAKQAVLQLAHLSYDVGVAEEGEAEAEAEAENGVDEDLEDFIMDMDSDEEPEEEPENESGKEIGKETKEDPKETEAPVTDGEELNGTGDEGESAAEEEDTTEAEQPSNEDEADAKTTDDNMQQRATLEMVLTVAGEFYGQRDLLAFRSPWPMQGKQRDLA